MLRDIILRNRSCRRFFEYEKIHDDLLKELIDLTRLCPSGANLQPLKFMILNDDRQTSKIFPFLAWAGYLTEWNGPSEGERPPAYIVILGDTSIKKEIDCDHGIAAQTILLGACEKGMSGCIIGSIKRNKLRKEFNIPDTYDILLVLAIGRPKEKIVLETVGPDEDIKYWRDENGVHHVPKRALEDIIVKF
ncbi:MAG: nitroreductase family protein [Calditrichia bacterium]|nr:nitroreductase family protein [Calditrichia bacterium]